MQLSKQKTSRYRYSCKNWEFKKRKGKEKRMNSVNYIKILAKPVLLLL